MRVVKAYEGNVVVDACKEWFWKISSVRSGYSKPRVANTTACT